MPSSGCTRRRLGVRTRSDHPLQLNGVARAPAEADMPSTPPDDPAAVTRTADGAVPAADGPDELPPVLGRYLVKSVLGRGAFGVVVLAQDEDLDRPVAVKVPHRRLVANPGDLARYLAEARALAMLDHPAVVPVHDVGRTADGLCFVVSKYVEGESLAARMDRGRVPPDRKSTRLNSSHVSI